MAQSTRSDPKFETAGWKTAKVRIGLYYEARADCYQRLLHTPQDIFLTVGETMKLDKVYEAIRTFDEANSIAERYDLIIPRDVVKIRLWQIRQESVILRGTDPDQVVWTESLVERFTGQFADPDLSDIPVIMVVTEPSKSRSGNSRQTENN